MRIITRCVKSTPLIWLPILSSITPPDLRRAKALLIQYNKVTSNPNIPLYEDLNVIPLNRLKSRKPPLLLAKSLKDKNFVVETELKNRWFNENIACPLFEFENLNNRKEEFGLPRKAFKNLNRLRTGHNKFLNNFSDGFVK